MFGSLTMLRWDAPRRCRIRIQASRPWLWRLRLGLR